MAVCVVPVADIMVPVFPVGTERPYGGTTIRLVSCYRTQQVSGDGLHRSWVADLDPKKPGKKSITMLSSFFALLQCIPLPYYCWNHETSNQPSACTLHRQTEGSVVDDSLNCGNTPSSEQTIYWGIRRGGRHTCTCRGRGHSIHRYARRAVQRYFQV